VFDGLGTAEMEIVGVKLEVPLSEIELLVVGEGLILAPVDKLAVGVELIVELSEIVRVEESLFDWDFDALRVFDEVRVGEEVSDPL